MRRAFLLLILLCASQTGWAQLQDTLEEQVIRGQRTLPAELPQMPGTRISTVDSEAVQRFSNSTVAALLTEQLPLFVRTTGVNGPATLSIRGASAAQSAVLWEGVPIQNAALGLTDLSLLQAGLFDNVAVVYGGNPALSGSGNVGGALLLSGSKLPFDSVRRFSGRAALGLGSFGRRSGLVGFQKSGWKSAFSIRLFGEEAQNDFTYSPADPALPKRTLTNAGYGGGGALLRAAQQTAGGVRLEQSLWFTSVRRQIPPALFEQGSIKEQRDAALRLRFSAEKMVRNVALKAQLAGFSESLHYEDAAVNLVSGLRVHTVFGEASARFGLGRWQLQTALPLQFSIADIAGANNPTQTRWGGMVTAGRDLFGAKLRTATTLRTEIIDGRTLVLPGESVSWQALPVVQLRAAVQRSYRAPTLQERYYFPGGNRALLPEEGWSYEGGMALKKPAGRVSNRIAATADFTVFQRDIKNWIIWYGGAIWTPHNIARVRTRGLEAEGELRYTAPCFNAGLRSAGSYTRATTMESVVARDGSVGSQIPHTPFWNARLGAWLGTARAQLHWNAAYTGFRYITSDESAFVPDFFVQNLTLELPLSFKRMNLRLQARCENVGNVSYVVVAGRPAPGRAFGVLLQVGLE